MDKKDVIKNIAKRTGGDIYLGVVGAVRTGKSTFIRRFMERMIVPYNFSSVILRQSLDNSFNSRDIIICWDNEWDYSFS